MSPEEPFSWPKRCACGRTYALDEWLDLRRLGSWPMEHLRSLDLRDCTCGSSITVPFKAVPATPLDTLNFVCFRDGFSLSWIVVDAARRYYRQHQVSSYAVREDLEARSIVEERLLWRRVGVESPPTFPPAVALGWIEPPTGIREPSRF